MKVTEGQRASFSSPHPCCRRVSIPAPTPSCSQSHAAAAFGMSPRRDSPFTLWVLPGSRCARTRGRRPALWQGTHLQGDSVLGWVSQMKTLRQDLCVPGGMRKWVREAGHGRGGSQTKHNFSKLLWKVASARALREPWSVSHIPELSPPRKGAGLSYMSSRQSPVKGCLGEMLRCSWSSRRASREPAAAKKSKTPQKRAVLQRRVTETVRWWWMDRQAGVDGGTLRPGIKGSEWI